MVRTQSNVRGAGGPDAMLVACPTDASLNRVPKAKLLENPRCGKCHNPLFQRSVVELTAANFEQFTARSDLPLVIDFWAEWCGPCRTMAPSLAAAAASLEPRVRLAKLNTENEQGIARRYGIQGIPSMILIYRGREIARTSGAMPTGAIVQWVEQALAQI